MKRITTFIILIAMLASAASCGSETPSSTDTTVADTTAAVTEHAEGYLFPKIDMGGKPFVVANSNTGSWGHYYHIDFAEATGDVLNDAVYNRNRLLEDTFNFKLEVFEENIETFCTTIHTAVMAGDDVCDIAYLRANKMTPLITDGCLYDLAQLNGLNLEEDWWDQKQVDAARVGKNRSLFFATNYFSLMSFDGTICTYFNESMLEDLKLDAPYDLVRSGNWTLDELYKYTSAGANLNGDESFAWNDNGNSVYGLATWANGYYGLLHGSGASFISLGNNGVPSIVAGDADFADACEKLAAGLFAKGTAGEFIETYSKSTVPYEEIFKRGRALMLVAQIKTSSKYRDLDDSFGIVPMPKYDAEQESYISLMPNSSALFCVPKTNPDADETAALADAMAYVSYRDVLKVYYESSVSQKGLRNDDSIEMLDIIRKSRVCDIGDVFGWTTSMQTAVYNKLKVGDGSVMSAVEAAKSAAEAAMDTTMKMLEA